MLLLSALIVSVAFAGLALYEASPLAQFPNANSGFAAAQANIKSYTIKHCSAVTTCETAGIHTLSYSAALVFVAANSSTAPKTVFSATPNVTFTKERGGSSASDTESYVYESSNITSGTMLVWVNFSASTTYLVGVVDLGNSSTSAVDAVGALQTVTSKTTSVSQTITLNTTNDIVFQGVSGSLNLTTITPGSGITELQSGTQASSVSAFQDYETFSATGSETMSATITKAFYAGVTIAIKYAGTPSAPTTLAAGTVTKQTVPLSWKKAPGPVSNYTAYYAKESAGSCGTYTGVNVPTSNGTAYTVTGLTTGQEYCFKVTQWNTSGQGTASSALSSITTAQVPAAPTSLTATAAPLSTTAINLVWTESGGGGLVNETIYQYANSGCTGTVTVTNLGSVQGSYSAQSLTSGSTYGFTVQDWNATGGSSATSCASTSPYALPGAPSSLGVTATTASSIALSWTQGSGTVSNDTIWIGSPVTTPSPYCTSLSTISAGAVSTYTVTGLNSAQKYCLAIQAYNGGGGGTRTAFINDTTLAGTPGSPTGLSVGSATNGTLTLTWTNPSGVTLVNNTVYRGTTCGTWTKFYSTGAAVTTYAVGKLANYTTYCYAISAWSSAGQSSLSGSASGTTLSGIPGTPTLSFVSASRTTITVSWVPTYWPGTYPLVNDTVYYFAGACGSTFTRISTGENTTSWQIGSLTAFTSYCIEVTVWSNGGQSHASNQLTEVSQSSTPPAPLNVTETASGVTYIAISWSNPSQYTLYNNSVLANAGGNCPEHYGQWTKNLNLAGVASTDNITGLSSGTTYCIVVIAWDGPSNYSLPLLAATLNGTPTTPNFWGPPAIGPSVQVGFPNTITFLPALGILSMAAGALLLVIGRRYFIGPGLLVLGAVMFFIIVW